MISANEITKMSESGKAEENQPLSLKSSSPACLFYKLIVASILHDKKLRIPSKFVRKIGNELSAVATLAIDNGREWLVEIKKSNRTWWFRNGWHEFVEHNCIHVGHLLVFRYEGNSNFNVYMFELKSIGNSMKGIHGKETECDDLIKIVDPSSLGPAPISLRNNMFDECLYPQTRFKSYNENKFKNFMHLTKDVDNLQLLQSTWNIGVQFNAGELSETTEEIEMHFPNEAMKGNRKRKQKFEPIKLCELRSSVHGVMRWRGVTNEEKMRASRAAEDFKPANPFCRIVMRPSYVYRAYLLHIPAKFAEKYLNGVSGTITLQVSGGKRWQVRCVYEGHAAKLSKGWLQFVVENNLDEGDVCVFELIELKDIVMNVTIFHVLEDPEPIYHPFK